MSLTGLKYYIKNPNRIYAFFSSRGILNWLPDKYYLKLSYRMNMHKKLNLKNPKSFNEKLQWIKLYDRNPEYSRIVDKYEVKKYVAETIGEEYIIPTLGVWDKFDDINFDELPNEFVLKCTHDSGGLVICRNKADFDMQSARNKIDRSLKRNYFYHGREWPYKNVKPRIIAEVYMDDFLPNEKGYGKGLTDYKFFTFNGITKMLYISHGLEDHSTAKISFFDLNGELMPFKRVDYAGFEHKINMPANIEKMIELSNYLSQKIAAPFLRVDLYEISGKIYFSELTFSPCGGNIPFDPPEWDEKLGEWVNIKMLFGDKNNE